MRESPYGPEPAATLLQTYTVDGETAPGMTVVQVVPAGAALLVTTIYGEWAATDPGGIAETVDLTRETVSAMALFDPAATPSSAAEVTPVPTDLPLAARPPDDDRSVFQVTRVGAARLMVQTYGEGSLASLDEQADGVTETTVRIVPAMCVFTKTGC